MLSRLERWLRSPTARAAGAVLGLALFALLLVRLASLWGDRPADLDRANWPLLALALAVSGLAMTCLAGIWAPAVRAVGAVPPRGLVAAYYLGQLAKYLPGGGWQYLGRAALAARLGLPLRAGAASLGVEALCMLGGAAAVAPLALAGSGRGAAGAAAALAAIGAAALAASRSPRVRRLAAAALRRAAGTGAAVRPRQVARAVALYAGSWAVFGLALWLIARALFAVPAADLALYAGVFAIAWIAGFAAVFAPGGLGVREAVLVALLASRIGESEAIVLATASRIGFTLVDLGGALAALSLLRRRAGLAPAAGAPAEPARPPSDPA